MIRDFRNLIVNEEEDYYKTKRAGHFWINNYVEHESNGDRNKTLSINPIQDGATKAPNNLPPQPVCPL